MDMATYTPHYQLHQWAASDDFLRTDFNADFGIIDGALGTLAADKIECVTGTYEGSGQDNRLIDLGRTPSAVILCDENSNMRDGSYTYGGIAMQGLPTLGLSVTEGGFTVRQSENLYCNYIGPYGSRIYNSIVIFR